MLPDLARAVAFGATITVTSLLVRGCGRLSEIGPRNAPLHPPKEVFGIVWACLYATTGASWALGGHKADAVMGVVTFLCCWWLVAYVCLRHKAVAACTLLATVGFLTVLAVALGGLPALLLLPLVSWTAFATYLNVFDVVHGALS